MEIIAFAKRSALFVIIIMKMLEQHCGNRLIWEPKEPKLEKRGFQLRFIYYFLCIKSRDEKRE